METGFVPALAWSVLVPILALACWNDVSRRRIPNALALTGLALGLALQALLPAGAGLFAPSNAGSIGLLAALAGFVAALVVGMVLWRLRLFGAGDAKLLAAVAAFTGLQGVVPLFLLVLAFGGVLALVALAGRRLRAAPAASVTAPAPPGRFPYAPAIAAGALIHTAMVHAGY